MTVDAPTITGAPLWRRATAEFLGTGLLVTIVGGEQYFGRQYSHHGLVGSMLTR